MAVNAEKQRVFVPRTYVWMESWSLGENVDYTVKSRYSKRELLLRVKRQLKYWCK